MVIAQRLAHSSRARIDAAVHIQSAWRAYKQYSWFKKLKSCVITFQAHVKGNNVRKTLAELKKRKKLLGNKIGEYKETPDRSKRNYI